MMQKSKVTRIEDQSRKVESRKPPTVAPLDFRLAASGDIGGLR